MMFPPSLKLGALGGLHKKGGIGKKNVEKTALNPSVRPLMGRGVGNAPAKKGNHLSGLGGPA